MTCHTQPCRPAAAASTPASQGERRSPLIPADRPAPELTAGDGRRYTLFPRGRGVALYLRREDFMLPAEVLCDLPGGRALVRLAVTGRHVWARQSSAARVVSSGEVL